MGQHRGRDFIAMELVPGETLASELTRGPLPLEELLRIAVLIAEGLAEAHAHAIVHRDIKPHNVMVLPDGRTKILDFGLAKPIESAPSEDSDTASMVSREGLVVGTVPYLPPE